MKGLTLIAGIKELGKPIAMLTYFKRIEILHLILLSLVRKL